MNQLGESLDRLELAEEVRALDDERGGLVVELRLQLLEVGAAVFVAGHHGRVGAAQVGLDDRAVLRMDGRREQDLAALSLPHIEGEQHRFGERGRSVIMAGVAHLHAR